MILRMFFLLVLFIPLAAQEDQKLMEQIAKKLDAILKRNAVSHSDKQSLSKKVKWSFVPPKAIKHKHPGDKKFISKLEQITTTILKNLTAFKIAIDKLMVTVKKKSKESSYIQKQIKQAQEKLEQTKRHLEQIQWDIDKLKLRYRELQAQQKHSKTSLQQLRTLYSHMQKNISVIYGLGIFPSLPPIKGKIISVKPSLQRAIIDVGNKKGVVPGHILQIFRSKQKIGQLIVTHTYENMAIGKFQEAPKAGDIVMAKAFKRKKK